MLVCATMIACASTVALAQDPPAASSVPSPTPEVMRPLEVPEGLDRSRRHASEQRRFLVSIHDTERWTRLNRIHNWTVTVQTADGKPIENAEIALDGGMPAHNHGFPTKPKVTKHIGNGTYLIEGVKFNMTGWWEFVFRIRAGELEDRVRFNVVIEE
jgi:hypothetical protein